MWPFKTELELLSALRSEFNELNAKYKELRGDYVYLLGNNADLRKMYSYRTPSKCQCKCCE